MRTPRFWRASQPHNHAAACCELLQRAEREDLRAIASKRLRDWHAVEVWEGPVCLVRLRRSEVQQS
jgi:hypothetical protein